MSKVPVKQIEYQRKFDNFFSLENILYGYKPTIRPSIEYFCHIWFDTSGVYLKILGKIP